MTAYHDMEMRVVYGETLNELIDAQPATSCCLEADLSKASRTDPDGLQATTRPTSSTAGSRRPT